MVLQAWESIICVPEEDELCPSHLYVLLCTLIHKENESAAGNRGWKKVMKHRVLQVTQEAWQSKVLEEETITEILSFQGFQHARSLAQSLYGKVPEATEGMLILALKAKQHIEPDEDDAIPVWDAVYECRPPFEMRGPMDEDLMCSLCDSFIFPTSGSFPINRCHRGNHPHHADCFAFYALEQEEEDCPDLSICLCYGVDRVIRAS
ncbi:hypothetical protein V2J09_003457 [Rumex salicifolius]